MVPPTQAKSIKRVIAPKNLPTKPPVSMTLFWIIVHTLYFPDTNFMNVVWWVGIILLGILWAGSIFIIAQEKYIDVFERIDNLSLVDDLRTLYNKRKKGA